MRCELKAYQLTIAMCAVYFVVAVAFAQTPSSGSKLTENPVYKEKCAKCHGKTAGAAFRRTFAHLGKNRCNFG
jgi:hypothetical protein